MIDLAMWYDHPPDERRRAFHEAGHAVVGSSFGAWPIEVSIVRGHDFGGVCTFDSAFQWTFDSMGAVAVSGALGEAFGQGEVNSRDPMVLYFLLFPVAAIVRKEGVGASDSGQIRTAWALNGVEVPRETVSDPELLREFYDPLIVLAYERLLPRRSALNEIAERLLSEKVLVGNVVREIILQNEPE